MSKYERYIIRIPETIHFAYALSKARYDVEQLAIERGYMPIEFRGLDSAHGNRLQWIRLGFLSVCDWLRILFVVKKGSIVLVQYPHLPVKSAPIVRVFIPLIVRLKHCVFTALVHDLDSMRGINGSAAVYSDTILLRKFQAVICHNERMKEALLQLGISPEKIFQLNLFDYLCDEVTEKPHAIFRNSHVKIAFAGNLSVEKSEFIYKLPSLLFDTVLLSLYGSGYCEIKSNRVQYHGVVPPQKLPAVLEADFGLVWDGSSTETCDGPYGKYLAFNNPHKVSLYLAAGIPVIIWSGAALAEFITKNGLGFSVASLSEIPGVISGLSDSTYQAMRTNAKSESRKVRTGYYFNHVLSEVETKCLNECMRHDF